MHVTVPSVRGWARGSQPSVRSSATRCDRL